MGWRLYAVVFFCWLAGLYVAWFGGTIRLEAQNIIWEPPSYSEFHASVRKQWLIYSSLGFVVYLSGIYIALVRQKTRPIRYSLRFLLLVVFGSAILLGVIWNRFAAIEGIFRYRGSIP